jgi:hypothetical protein
MIYQKDTNIGQISVAKNVVTEIIYKAVRVFGNNVVVDNYAKSSNKLYYKMSGGADSNAIEITNSESGIAIKIYIMVKFGTSISKVSKLIISEVNEGFAKTFGMKPSSTEVIITGVFSKNVVRRNIKVTEKR